MRPTLNYVAGHTRLIGSAAVRRFGAEEKYCVDTTAHRQRALRDAGAVQRFKRDIQKADGAPRKVLDSRPIDAARWRTRIRRQDGVNRAYAWYQKNVKSAEVAS